MPAGNGRQAPAAAKPWASSRCPGLGTCTRWLDLVCLLPSEPYSSHDGRKTWKRKEEEAREASRTAEKALHHGGHISWSSTVDINPCRRHHPNRPGALLANERVGQRPGQAPRPTGPVTDFAWRASRSRARPCRVLQQKPWSALRRAAGDEITVEPESGHRGESCLHLASACAGTQMVLQPKRHHRGHLGYPRVLQLSAPPGRRTARSAARYSQRRLSWQPASQPQPPPATAIANLCL